MNPLYTIELAEIRRAELIEQAEQHRLAHGAVDFHRGRTPWRRGLREELTALWTRMSAMRRPALNSPAKLAPAAVEST